MAEPVLIGVKAGANLYDVGHYLFTATILLTYINRQRERKTYAPDEGLEPATLRLKV